MDELKKLRESEAHPRDVTGVLAPSWLNHHINVMKPVKKFLNMNDMTQFA